MSLAIALRNKQIFALVIVALLTLLIVATIVASFVFHFNVWHIFTPGTTGQGRYS